MTNKRTLTILTVLFLAVVPNLHATKCSNASLKGTYAYSAQGFTEVTPDISPASFVPWVQTGLIVYDGNGNILSGTFTVNTTTANGGPFRGTFTGPTPSTRGQSWSTLEMAPCSTLTLWFRARPNTPSSAPIPMCS